MRENQKMECEGNPRQVGITGVSKCKKQGNNHQVSLGVLFWGGLTVLGLAQGLLGRHSTTCINDQVRILQKSLEWRPEAVAGMQERRSRQAMLQAGAVW
jgi:hypothetical protein